MKNWCNYKSNYHMHTLYCDGNSSVEEYVVTAISRGFASIGITTHVPIPLMNDWSLRISDVDKLIAEVAFYKEKYAGEIEIYFGFEMDYADFSYGTTNVDKEKVEHFHYLSKDGKSLDLGHDFMLAALKKADYHIGSVHYVYDKPSNQYFSTDGSLEELFQTFDYFGGGNHKKCIARYYDEVKNIIENQDFQILGHLDIIKKQNQNQRFFNEDEGWYKELVVDVLDAAKKKGIIVEINTGGMSRGYIHSTYPSNWIISEMKHRNIPILISSDAHHKNHIDYFFEETRQILKSIGFVTQKALLKGQWVDVVL